MKKGHRCGSIPPSAGCVLRHLKFDSETKPSCLNTSQMGFRAMLYYLVETCLMLVIHSGSCGARGAFAHAGPQHESTLLGDFWIFNHALPQPLLLPVWVHPVHLVPVTCALRGQVAKNNPHYYCVTYNLQHSRPLIKRYELSQTQIRFWGLDRVYFLETTQKFKLDVLNKSPESWNNDKPGRVPCGLNENST